MSEIDTSTSIATTVYCLKTFDHMIKLSLYYVRYVGIVARGRLCLCVSGVVAYMYTWEYYVMYIVYRALLATV